MRKLNYLRLIISLVLYTVILYYTYFQLKRLLPLFNDISYITIWLMGYVIVLFFSIKILQKKEKMGIKTQKLFITAIWKKLETRTKISFIFGMLFALIGFAYLFSDLVGISFLFFIIGIIPLWYSIWKIYKLRIRKK